MKARRPPDVAPREGITRGISPLPASPSCASSSKAIEARVICGVRIDATSYDDTVSRVIEWSQRGESRMICFSNVHMVMEAKDSEEYRQALLGADIVAPDGLPLVWALRILGARNATRVYGPDSTELVAAAAELSGVPIALYGGSSDTLERFRTTLQRRFPGLDIRYACAPPFRPLSEAERQEHIQAIRDSGARIVLVGLGCPKQEKWMAAHRGVLPAVMLGVGAAFDFLSGTKSQAPRWMMAAGLEWLFRLQQEPRRLWRRYLKQNPRFIAHFLMQLIGANRQGVL